MSTKKCPNCDTEIAENIFILHQRFCYVNLRKCSICNENILIEEYDEHKENEHTKKSCEICGKKFDSKSYEKHKESCSNKLIPCQYCELHLSEADLKEHEYMCGAKTVQCELCNENIPRLEIDLHMKYTCTQKDKIKKNNNNDCKNINSIDNNNKIDKDFKENELTVDEIIQQCMSGPSKKYIENDEYENLKVNNNNINKNSDFDDIEFTKDNSINNCNVFEQNGGYDLEETSVKDIEKLFKDMEKKNKKKGGNNKNIEFDTHNKINEKPKKNPSRKTNLVRKERKKKK